MAEEEEGSEKVDTLKEMEQEEEEKEGVEADVKLVPKSRVKRGHSEWYRQASQLASLAMAEGEGEATAVEAEKAVEETKDDSGLEQEEELEQEMEQEEGVHEDEETWYGEYQAEDEWIQEFTEEGHAYFYNTRTGESQWDDPYADEESSYAEAYESQSNYSREAEQHHHQQQEQLTLEQKWEAFEKEMNLKPEKFIRKERRFKDAKSPSPARSDAGRAKTGMVPKRLDTSAEEVDERSNGSSGPISPRSLTRAFNR